MAETAEQSEDQPISNVIFKVIVIGDAGVGKSAFIDRYVHRHFVRYQYNATLGGKLSVSRQNTLAVYSMTCKAKDRRR